MAKRELLGAAGHARLGAEVTVARAGGLKYFFRLKRLCALVFPFFAVKSIAPWLVFRFFFFFSFTAERVSCRVNAACDVYTADIVLVNFGLNTCVRGAAHLLYD